jgi:hypothetical protein
MTAEILKWEGLLDGGIEEVTEAAWVNYQDPITGEFRSRWSAGPELAVPTARIVVPCIARAIVDGGIRVAGTTERFGEDYLNVDYVRMWVPAHVKITKRDRVTNISHKNEIMWMDEEYDGAPRATVFNVNGVAPLFDAFNKLVEQSVTLQKAN